jgi:CubicO group peptidase (beta-lactamase class C family)
MKGFLFMVSGFLVTVSAFAQITKELDSVIKSYVATGEPGIALRVETKGKVLYNKGFGLADISTKTPINAETNFRMASVSKQFTAMGVLLLEKEGKISFDDPISDILPEIPGRIGKKVRIRHLLTHSSGLIDYEALMGKDLKEQLQDKDILSLLKNQDTTYFEPGTQFRYSNSAYCLLTLIIERVSKQSFPVFIKERIFKPLNMNASKIYVASEQIPNRAIGYARDKKGKIKFSDQSLTSATKGDGGVYTSVIDYTKWVTALRANSLLDLSAVSKRLNFKISEIPDSYYNAGWFLENSANTMLFHSGSTCGFSTFVILIPQEDTSIIYFSNIANNDKPFIQIMKVLSETGISSEKILALHQATR